MLIPSDRHTDADLELWAELEEADAIHAARPALAARSKQSIASICEFAEAGPCHAGTSWGKDSVVLCHLLWNASPDIPLMHLRPTNHNPDCDAVRDRYFAQFPGQSYTEVVVDYSGIDRVGLPDHEVDRLTDERWYAAIRDYEAVHYDRHLLGIRSDESFGRMIRTLRWGINTARTSAPLAHWRTADIYAYLALHNLPVHPAYAMLGGGRWPRERLRVAEIGDTHGKGSGRRDWEAEYYGDVLRRGEVST